MSEQRDHARYLTYRETHPYFRRADLPLLGWEPWRALDAEYKALVALAKETTTEQRARLKAVRALLLRD